MKVTHWRWLRDGALAMVVTVLAVALGCAEANPLPSPFDDPALNASQVYVSSVSPEEAAGTLMLVGLPEAVQNASLVRVAIEAAAYQADLALGADGSFSALVDGVPQGAEVFMLPVAILPESQEELPGPALTLVVGGVDRRDDSDLPWVAPSAGGQDGDPTELNGGAGAEVPAPSDEGVGGGTWSPSGLVVSPPDAAGQVRLTVPPYGMSSFTFLFVLNDDTGLQYTGLSANDGSLGMSVAAQTGHTLWAFAANPVTRQSTTESFSIEVPAAD